MRPPSAHFMAKCRVMHRKSRARTEPAALNAHKTRTHTRTHANKQTSKITSKRFRGGGGWQPKPTSAVDISVAFSMFPFR